MKNLNKNKKGYKHTPLGWIPEDWMTLKIKDFAETTAGGTPSTSKTEYWGGKIRWMNSGELNLKKVYEVEGRITELGLENSSTRVIPPKSVLIGLAGQGKTRGTVAMNMIELCTNQSVAAVLPNYKFIPEYLYYNLDNRYQELRRLSTGDGGRGGLNLGIIDSIAVPFPSKHEQALISNVISVWDKAIETTQNLIATKEQLKKGLMQQLLTGKKRLPGFNSEWKKVRIGEVVKEVKRPIEWNDDKLYDLISVRRRSVGVFYRESLYGHQILTKGLFTAKVGDFLISKMQIVHGASGMVKKEHDGMFISGSYISLHSKDESKLNIEFFDWLSKTPEFYHLCFTSSYGVHIEKMTFDFQDFLHRQIVIPTDIKEQESIVKVLNTLIKEIDLLKTQLELYRQQKKGLMQVLLTGAVRVKV